MNLFTRTAARTLCLLSILTAAGSSIVLAGDAELVWVENGEVHQIMSSQFEKDGWTAPVAVYSSERPLTSVAMSTDLDDTKIMVWTEQFKTRSVLMKMQLRPKSTEWSKAALFSDFGKENMAATMVVDATNVVWVFWAANHGDLDDIYLVKRSKQGWSKPQIVNDKNEVPDVRPVASLDSAGNVALDWRSYSFDEGQYVTLNRVFELDIPWQNGYKSDPREVKEISIADVGLPDFLPDTAVALMHFRSNRMHQTEKLELNRNSAP